jgi:hypothetical protein
MRAMANLTNLKTSFLECGDLSPLFFEAACRRYKPRQVAAFQKLIDYFAGLIIRSSQKWKDLDGL